MRVVRLTSFGQETPYAKKYINKKNNKTYWHLLHGFMGRAGSTTGLRWCYRMCLNYKHFAGNEDKDSLSLHGINYYIQPIVDNQGTPKKDNKGNILYSLNISKSTEPTTGCIVLWELPFLNIKNIQYFVKGHGRVVAKGSIGRINPDGILEQTDAPIVEIYGNCDLEYIAETYDNSNSERYIYFRARYNSKQDALSMPIVLKSNDRYDVFPEGLLNG